MARQVLQQYPELLGDLAEGMPAQAAESAQSDPQLRQALLDHLALLWRCRQMGTDAAFASLAREVDDARDTDDAGGATPAARALVAGEADDGGGAALAARALVAAIHQFIFAPTPALARRVLEDHPKLLTDARVEFILANARSPNAEAQAYNRRALDLIRHCRSLGTDAAFAGLG